MNNGTLGNTIMMFGVLLLIIGAVFQLLSRFGIPKIPGDIFIQREGFTFYFPIVSSIIISLILSFLFNLFSRK